MRPADCSNREPEAAIVPGSADRLQSAAVSAKLDDVLTEQVLSALVKVKPSTANGITVESTLESLGLDSLDTISLLFELESQLGVSIPDEDARSVRTVGDIIEHIRRLKDAAPAGP
jgi:acyl carrier protein